MYCSTNFLFELAAVLEDCPGTEPREVTIVVRHSSASAPSQVGQERGYHAICAPCWAYPPIIALIPCECPRSRSANCGLTWKGGREITFGAPSCLKTHLSQKIQKRHRRDGVRRPLHPRIQ